MQGYGVGWNTGGCTVGKVQQGDKVSRASRPDVNERRGRRDMRLGWMLHCRCREIPRRMLVDSGWVYYK